MFDFLSNKFSSIFAKLTGQDRLTEKNMDETLGKFSDALIEADVPYDVVNTFMESVKKEILGKKILASLKPSEMLMKIIHEKIVAFLSDGTKFDDSFLFQIPSTVMVMGLQGSGKTTTIGKLATYAKNNFEKKGKKRKILVASVDFYRPAAVDQLEILAQKAGVLFYRATETNPVLAAREIHTYAKKELIDLLFLDTAGRLHVDNQMLEELKEIDKIVNPKYKILVLDAMTGQESLTVAKTFESAVGFTGAILTKMDSETRAGAAFAFRYVLKKPLMFVSTGEKLGDLEKFRPDRLAGRIIGAGDMMSLVEKAQEKIKQSDQDKMYSSLMQGKFTLADFAQQMDMVNKLGSLSSLMKYIPGMGNMNVTPDMMQKGEVELKKFKAIISSMTMKEKILPKILDGSRKLRIAKGAGVAVADVNSLLSRFEQSQQFVKLFKNMGGRNPF